LSGALETREEAEMTVPKGKWGHNAVFEEATDRSGTMYWKVFETEEGRNARKVLIGEIRINRDGFESPLVFVGASTHLYEWLNPQAEEFFGSYIESRFIYQLAEFMRELESRLIKSYIGYKVLSAEKN
jgi:hypothetical protein